jgi:ATP-binding protein involved in chromosome partitioning
MIDPRRSVVEKRLRGVDRIVAFCSAKGGVGKTFCASVGALLLARASTDAGQSPAIGLFDLDFQGASAHIVLGEKPRLPDEKEGILPGRTRDGIALLTAASFTGDRGLPLRGPEVTDAILELFAVTQWGRLNALLLDMPPGIGDEILDLLALIPRLEVLAVSTPSRVSIAVVERLLGLLAGTDAGVLGLMSNMSSGDAEAVQGLAQRSGLRYLGDVPFDPRVEREMGRPAGLLGCPASRALERVLSSAGLLPALD